MKIEIEMETKIARPPLIEVSPIANAHTTIIFPPYTALPIRYHTTIPPHTVLLYSYTNVLLAQ